MVYQSPAHLFLPKGYYYFIVIIIAIIGEPPNISNIFNHDPKVMYGDVLQRTFLEPLHEAFFGSSMDFVE